MESLRDRVGSLFDELLTARQQMRRSQPQPGAFEAWASEGKSFARAVLGLEDLPAAVLAEVQSEEIQAGVRRRTLRYQTALGSWANADLLLPPSGTGPFPGVVLLHEHGGNYLWGRRSLVEEEKAPAALMEWQQLCYGGNAIGPALARQGFAVLAADALLFGDRRIHFDDEPSLSNPQRQQELNKRLWHHEETVQRALAALGTSLARVITQDDVRAVSLLAQQPEVDSSRLAALGFSFGGYRALQLYGLDDRIGCAASLCGLTDFAAALDGPFYGGVGFTMLEAALLARYSTADIASFGAPKPLLVLLGETDALYPGSARDQALETLRRRFAEAGAQEALTGAVVEGGHHFGKRRQAQVFPWLVRQLYVGG
ncbi:MAG: dienelactone hydrolase family protein [Firmicutes bacterium]|nr:dienelactone hydrolase family protein [Bacillota bacterium]